jgi:hypothetical protein
MSIASWKKAFYVEKADDVAKRSDLEMLEHAKLKWEGLSKDNLEEHNLLHNGKVLRDKKEAFNIDASTCPLCVKYLRNIELRCKECPLFRERKVPCDQKEQGKHPSLSEESPYHSFYHGNNRSMLDLINQAIESLLQGGAESS